MNVFNRRNALVGYFTLKAASRALDRRRRRQRAGRGLKVALFVVLAVVSVGILAGVAAAFMRKRAQELDLAEDDEAVVEEAEAEDEAAAEPDAAAAEPIPAT